MSKTQQLKVHQMHRSFIPLFICLLLGSCVENDPQQSRWKQLIADPSVPPILERIGPGKAYLIRNGEIWGREYSSETKYLPAKVKIDCNTDAFACDTLLPFMKKWGVNNICCDYHGASVAVTLYNNPKVYNNDEGVIYFRPFPEQLDTSVNFKLLYHGSGIQPRVVRQENSKWCRYSSYRRKSEFEAY